ncbi:uncharacterized protein LOC122923609 [Bufo gargarizans]|uniref:uncharacterized protein LOC122923609 n=1 Tax=Bufo gargarizans TaxID=30331 RepID=UPI001CF4113C|nr:uncharacterized protein LOC122923609 [Bufo gargarizans]
MTGGWFEGAPGEGLSRFWRISGRQQLLGDPAGSRSRSSSCSEGRLRLPFRLSHGHPGRGGPGRRRASAQIWPPLGLSAADGALLLRTLHACRRRVQFLPGRPDVEGIQPVGGALGQASAGLISSAAAPPCGRDRERRALSRILMWMRPLSMSSLPEGTGLLRTLAAGPRRPGKSGRESSPRKSFPERIRKITSLAPARPGDIRGSSLCQDRLRGPSGGSQDLRLMGSQHPGSQWERFRQLAPGAEERGLDCPSGLWELLETP